MIHAGGMVDLAPTSPPPPASRRRRRAPRDGAPVLCDTAMVAAGVTRARLPARNEVVCSLREPGVAELAAAMGTTRSAAALEHWRQRLGGAVVAVGNAPTALFRLLEMRGAATRARGPPRSSAAPSASSAPRSRRPPWPTIRRVRARRPGRLGGSAVAVAAVNALAREAAVE